MAFFLAEIVDVRAAEQCKQEGRRRDDKTPKCSRSCFTAAFLAVSRATRPLAEPWPAAFCPVGRVSVAGNRAAAALLSSYPVTHVRWRRVKRTVRLVGVSGRT